MASQSGLKFIETEESYTSITSFLDDDFRPLYCEKPRRVETIRKKRKKTDLLGGEQYQTTDVIRINRDCNGAANVFRKISSQLKLSLAKQGV